MSHVSTRHYFAILIILPAFATAQELLDPGWDDPAFASYLGALDTRSGIDRQAITTGILDTEGEAVEFTLPVLGFAHVEREDADRSGLGGVPYDPAALGQGISLWPECANNAPIITTVPLEPESSAGTPTGSWYVRSFDYGCMEIVLEGDQNPLPEGFGTSNLPPSGTIEVNWFDENAGVALDETGRTVSGRGTIVPRGVPTVSVTLGSLIYGMEVYCVDRSTIRFCDSEQALRALAQRLTVVGGAPK